MPTYSLLDPFEFLYYFYRIWGELIKVLSIIVCIPNTFCPTLDHHQGRICYKSDVIINNSSPSIGVLQKTNVIYKFKCPLGDCISDNNNIYVGLTSTTLSRRLTIHLSDTSSIAQHLKKHSCPTTQLRKILTDNTTILEHQNNKQKLQILKALYIRNLQPALNRINFQTSANVLKCL